MECYDRILRANVKMLIFVLYSKMFQKMPMFRQFTVTLSNTIFGPQYLLGDSCTVFRPEHGSASRIALSSSVFEKIDFEKKCKFSNLNIFCAETVIVIRLLAASNYSMNLPEYNDISYCCIIII